MTKDKWKKKLKRPTFWSKLAMTGLGIAVASGYVPESLSVMAGEHAAETIGALIAAGFGIWLGKDDEKEKSL